MKIAIAAFTRNGVKQIKKLIEPLSICGHIVHSYTTIKFAEEYHMIAIEDLNSWAEQCFRQYDAILLVGACGIAVRAIAPWVKDKTKDPAVLVMDDNAAFVISLLSGHIGGANKLSREVALIMHAIPVITTASDVNHQFAVDEWAEANELHILDISKVKITTAALLDKETIGITSDFEIDGILPQGLSMTPPVVCGICISLDADKTPYIHTLNLIPKIITIGVGCRKGVPFEMIESVVLESLKEANISIHAVKNICSIDLKQEETGILQFAHQYNIPFITYTKDELNKVNGEFKSSAFVESITGTDNVCERAAVLGSGNGQIVRKKHADNFVTTAIAQSEWKTSFGTKANEARQEGRQK